MAWGPTFSDLVQREIFTTGTIFSIAVLNGGSGYAPSSTTVAVTITGGGGTGATANATTNASGVIISVQITAAGSGYNAAPSSITAAGGTGASFLANYVTIIDQPKWDLLISNLYNWPGNVNGGTNQLSNCTIYLGFGQGVGVGVAPSYPFHAFGGVLPGTLFAAYTANAWQVNSPNGDQDLVVFQAVRNVVGSSSTTIGWRFLREINGTLQSTFGFNLDSAGDSIDFTNGGLPQTIKIVGGNITFLNGADINFAVTPITLANGVNNNVNFAGQIGEISGPTAAYSISGFIGGVSGQELRIVDTEGQVCTLLNQNSGSSAGNQIVCPGMASIALSAFGCAHFVYVGTYWRLVSHT